MCNIGWDEEIKNSKFFIIIANKEFFEDAICICKAQYAKDLKKPFIILLEKGVEIPVGFLDGIKEYRIGEFEYPEDIPDAFIKLLPDFTNMGLSL